MGKTLIREGLKFQHIQKPEWSYQISDIEDDLVVVSWILNKNIKSTTYEIKDVEKYFSEGTWVVVSSDISVVHPKEKFFQ